MVVLKLVLSGIQSEKGPEWKRVLMLVQSEVYWDYCKGHLVVLDFSSTEHVGCHESSWWLLASWPGFTSITVVCILDFWDRIWLVCQVVAWHPGLASFETFFHHSVFCSFLNDCLLTYPSLHVFISTWTNAWASLMHFFWASTVTNGLVVICLAFD